MRTSGRSNRYLLTPAARADLQEISSFIRKENPQAARRVVRELREAMRKLAALPGIGHLREDLAGEPLRFWSVRSYLIIYRPEMNPLEIVRVLHSARDIRSILG